MAYGDAPSPFPALPNLPSNPDMIQQVPAGEAAAPADDTKTSPQYIAALGNPTPPTPSPAAAPPAPVISAPTQQQTAAPAKNPWEGIASPVGGSSAPQAANPWEGIASPVNNESEISHDVGVIGRDAVNGITQLGTIVPNLAVTGYNLLTGSKVPTPAENVDAYMTKIGVPKAETSVGRVASDAATGLIGGGPLGPMAAIAGATSGASSGTAREMGAGPIVQLVSGIIGGMAPTNAANVVKQLAQAGYTSAKEILNPANSAAIGKILISQADDPESVIQRLHNAAPQFVAGSNPTLAEVAGDNGLIAGQRAFENNNPGALAATRQANTGARNDLLNNMSGTPQDLSNAYFKRSAVTEPLYQAAKNDPVNPISIQPVLDKIDQAIAQVGEHTQAGGTLSGLKNDIKQSLSAPNQGPLVQVYREARDAAAKSAMQDGAYSSAVKGVVKPLIYQLGQALEAQSPNLATANAKFKDLSGPINQMEELQSIRDAATKNVNPDINGNQNLRPAPINSAMSPDGVAKLSRVLTPQQMKNLDNLQQDIARQGVMNTVSPVGSATAANAKANNDLNNTISGIIAKHLDSTPFVKGSGAIVGGITGAVGGHAVAGIPGAVIGGVTGAVGGGMAQKGAGIAQALSSAYSNPDVARQAMIDALTALRKENIPIALKQGVLDSILGTTQATAGINSGNATSAHAYARDAIARGAPKAAVMQRLQDHGYDPGGL